MSPSWFRLEKACGVRIMATSSPPSRSGTVLLKKSALQTWSASKTQMTSLDGMSKSSPG